MKGKYIPLHTKKPFRPHYGYGIDSTYKWNECQRYLLGVKVAGAYGC
jgi:hypothetical protein